MDVCLSSKIGFYIVAFYMAHKKLTPIALFGRGSIILIFRFFPSSLQVKMRTPRILQKIPLCPIFVSIFDFARM